MDIQIIQNKIYEIRGQRVMLDFDLAELYQVTTSALNQAVKRNIERFPEEFMFRISEIEWENMSSQFVTTSRVKRPKTSLPYAFTEQGVAMLSAVLRSGMAIRVSISIMKAFVAMRNYITTATTVTSELAEIRAKLALLERADADNAEAVSDLSEDIIIDLFKRTAEADGEIRDMDAYRRWLKSVQGVNLTEELLFKFSFGATTRLFFPARNLQY